MLKEILPDLYLIRTKKPSSNSYLIQGEDMNVLIDPGINERFKNLNKELKKLEVDVRNLDMVINTHEHVDHFGANQSLPRNVPILAHRYAAAKIVSADDEVLLCRAHGENPKGYHVHMWLENLNVINLGDWFLKILHTPGHTSGSLCIYEPRQKVLISGDTVFAKGTISNISSSGSHGEYINSLARLNTMKIDLLLPGHGSISVDVEEDIHKAIENAKMKHDLFLKKS
ncbi:MAG TPA: MBL fold metallo-hydrolase [Methanobacterium sp.]|nr:MBL fold metallo-hydrolase [Methanobacterium sp.]